MNEEVKRILREKNNVISQEEYQNFFSSINNPNVCWVNFKQHLREMNSLSFK